MGMFKLNDKQVEAAARSADRARDYLDKASYPLGVAIVNHAWSEGSAEAVVQELAAYQNLDGGFGKGLEVDIASPASNPFATRLAMLILLDLDRVPKGTVVADLARWLAQNQADDGDWHFSEETKLGELAPWFAAWTFPALNPSCCIAGLANRLGIATPIMLDRVGRLFDRLSSLDDARTGDFYGVLPYAEYMGGVYPSNRDAWLDALADNIGNTAERGDYTDAGHFWDHALGGGPELARRLPEPLLSRFADQLIAEQQDDGGWRSPYDQAWRPFITTRSCSILARLRDGI